MWNENMPKLIVDNDTEKEEKVSDVFMVTKEFHTSAEFSQHIERKAVATIKPSIIFITSVPIKLIIFNAILL